MFPHFDMSDRIMPRDSIDNDEVSEENNNLNLTVVNILN
jgi:hypothetical protein